MMMMLRQTNFSVVMKANLTPSDRHSTQPHTQVSAPKQERLIYNTHRSWQYKQSIQKSKAPARGIIESPLHFIRWTAQ
jgi:hypothetical protein